MFQPATDADLAAIAALMNRAYRGAGGSAGWSNESAYLAGDRTTEALLREDAGQGRMLLAAAEQWARDHGAARVRMTVVNVRASLIAWYLRRGYAPIGETSPFSYGDDRFGTPLRDDLAFVALEKALA